MEMANYLKVGSSGSRVKELQELLNQNGYNLTVDGIYGSATKNAVTKYQKANKLGVDGIVGDETWGSLTKSGGNTTVDGSETVTPSATTPLGNTYNPTETTGSKTDLSAIEGAGPTFQQSQAYKDALGALQSWQGQKPGEYVSPFADRLNALYEQVVNRPGFTYDFNADPIYQHYNDRYTQSAKMAMQDTMANAAALSGGYGSSWAQSAGQQAYAQTMQGLNDVIPTLYQDAWNRYQAEGQGIMDQLALVQGMDQTEYGRYADRLNDYYAQLNYLYGAANDAYNRDYSVYQDALNQWLENRDYYYGKTQDELQQENYEREFEQAYGGKSSGGGSSSGSSSSKGSSSSSGSSSKGNMSEKNTDKEDADSGLPTLNIFEARRYLNNTYEKYGIEEARREMNKLISNKLVEGDDVKSKLQTTIDLLAKEEKPWRT